MVSQFQDLKEKKRIADEAELAAGIFRPDEGKESKAARTREMDVIRAILVSAEAVAKLDWGEDLVERGEKGEFIWSQKEMFGESGNWVKEKERPIQSDNDIKRAAKEWCNNRSVTEAKYGHIKDWDTSAVTDMKEEFDKDRAGQGALQFNDDISRWNVGQVKDMYDMFEWA
ncbi:hypothetical protein TL16_g10259 [Triparma laevis f. inornata]|uniref:Uncharacterized protein n=1 Tax=Triparma laevis f. inornata TaxID=1714386 RepID=A0A9W7BF12_9STRA|nr:hypothetical protein TL16_g10259 [Triparma laevis f. inornata]